MKCIKCGREIPDGNNRCNACGEEIKIGKSINAANLAAKVQTMKTSTSQTTPSDAQTTATNPLQSIIDLATNVNNTAAAKKKNNWVGAIIGIVLFAGAAIFGSIDDKAKEKNLEALNLLETTSNYDTAISQFESAANEMTSDTEKIEVLKNLGFAYLAADKDTEALATFKKALALVDSDPFNYNLINGEIALLENKPQDSLNYYLKALAEKPNDFQINSTIGVFYLGTNEVTNPFTDYNKALLYNLTAYNDNTKSETTKETLAWNYYYVGKYNEAINLLLTTTLQNKPSNNFLLGLCHYELNDDAHAKKYFQTAKEQGFELGQNVEDYLAGEED